MADLSELVIRSIDLSVIFLSQTKKDLSVHLKLPHGGRGYLVTIIGYVIEVRV